MNPESATFMLSCNNSIAHTLSFFLRQQNSDSTINVDIECGGINEIFDLLADTVYVLYRSFSGQGFDERMCEVVSFMVPASNSSKRSLLLVVVIDCGVEVLRRGAETNSALMDWIMCCPHAHVYTHTHTHTHTHTLLLY